MSSRLDAGNQVWIQNEQVRKRHPSCRNHQWRIQVSDAQLTVISAIILYFIVDVLHTFCNSISRMNHRMRMMTFSWLQSLFLLNLLNDAPTKSSECSNICTQISLLIQGLCQCPSTYSYLSHELNYSRLSHPFDHELRARISIHPSDMIPVPEFYPTISLYQYSRLYVINFQKTISHLLEKPYQTDCFKYDFGS